MDLKLREDRQRQSERNLWSHLAYRWGCTVGLDRVRVGTGSAAAHRRVDLVLDDLAAWVELNLESHSYWFTSPFDA